MHTISQERSLQLLRWALGITFIWFGILKVFNASPVSYLINAVAPFSFPMEIPLIGLFEICLGLGFFMKRFTRVSSMLMVFYLLGITVLVLVKKGFSPWFPLLTLEGEFVIKNLVLMAAGFILFSMESHGEKIASFPEK